MNPTFDQLPCRVQPRSELKAGGSLLARGLLRLAGWRLLYEGLPAKQGVIMVYPHTSNWDFIVGVLAKWACGLQVRFWGKHSLFKLPLFGRWLRWLGGVAIDRSSAKGTVGDTVAQMLEARAADRMFWLALAPEGTRSLTSGWRSGSYQLALQADVPVGLAYFDYSKKVVGVIDFYQLSGDPDRDFALFEQQLSNRCGKRAELASPIRLKS